MFIELSQTMGVFVCVVSGVVSKYFLFLCLLNAVPSNASQQCFPEVTNFLMAQPCYSKVQLGQPVRWGNVQHSLNMSSVCLKILRHVSMCIIIFLKMISITVLASCIASGELVLHWPKGGSIPIFQGHCWKWCHFMYFSKLDDYFETWKCLHILVNTDFSYCTYLSPSS
jgi:hypothetical protein